MSPLKDLNDLEFKSTAEGKLFAIDNHEGDWKAYLGNCEKFQGNAELQRCFGTLTDYKRECALAYMGRRAQHNGGVCSKTHPRIFTPAAIAELEKMNKAQRYRRYPWLEKLINLIDEIEQHHEQIAVTGNVISLVPAPR